MARQKGILKLKGQMGGLTFYKSGQDGFLVREKSGVDGDRIKNDPRFARTRENGAEFGRAGRAGKLLRTALRTLLLNTKDNRMSSRLTKVMMDVIHTDQTSARGLRNVIDGETELLLGFEFNDNAKLSNTFSALYTPTINRGTGVCEISLPAYSPEQMIGRPEGATHYRLILGTACIDFREGALSMNENRSAEIEIVNTQTPVLTLDASLPAGLEDPIFMAFGIEFFQLVSGKFYPLKNGACNSLSLVAIDGGV